MSLSQPYNASFSWHCAAGNVSVWDLAYHFYFKRLKNLFLISRREVLEFLQSLPERVTRRGLFLLDLLLFQLLQHLQYLFITMRPAHLFQLTHPLHRNAEIDELIDPVGQMQMTFSLGDIIYIRVFFLLVHDIRVFH